MNKTLVTKTSKFFLATLALTLAFSGCAIEAPKKPAGIEQRIQNAHTTAEHEAIAAEYERQAQTDKATARTHRDMAKTYKYYAGPRGTNPGAFSLHCDNLAKLYEEAADENVELAKLHREAAAGMK